MGIETFAMLGGGKERIKSVMNSKGPWSNKLSLLAILLFFLIIKALVVQITYNKVWPVLVRNSGGSTHDFKPLVFQEALLITILFNFLF